MGSEAREWVPVPPPFTVRSLAERWHCSEGVVRKAIDDGRLNPFRIGVLIRIPVAEVERFEQCQKSQNTASNDSEEDTRSSIMTKQAPAAVAGSTRVIGRAPRRKRETSGTTQSKAPSLSVVS